jgi:hypothetical protein
MPTFGMLETEALMTDTRLNKNVMAQLAGLLSSAGVRSDLLSTKVQEIRARGISHFLNQALAGIPQLLTNHGRPSILLSVDDLMKLLNAATKAKEDTKTMSSFLPPLSFERRGNIVRKPRETLVEEITVRHHVLPIEVTH